MPASQISYFYLCVHEEGKPKTINTAYGEPENLPSRRASEEGPEPQGPYSVTTAMTCNSLGLS